MGAIQVLVDKGSSKNMRVRYTLKIILEIILNRTKIIIFNLYIICNIYRIYHVKKFKQIECFYQTETEYFELQFIRKCINHRSKAESG